MLSSAEPAKFDRKQRDAWRGGWADSRRMTNADSILDEEAAWSAVTARDRKADGRFVTGVMTTGIYCRPSCPARHPRRENVRFFADGAAARAAGLRPCLRCTPDAVAADRQAVDRALRRIEAEGGIPRLDALATEAGYSPHHFHRLFKRATGVTPAGYARALRARRAEAALESGGSVTGAIFDAGFESASRFYDASNDRLGMAPSVWRDGGRGETIHWVVAKTSLGPLLIAATRRGLCRIAFEEDAAALRERFPKAVLQPAGADFADLAARAVAEVERPGSDPSLPLDVRGTAFQEAVWQALRAIPVGETRSYGEIASSIGAPLAVRAVGSACGANPVAIAIPCHRALRGDGSLGGYAWGLERKTALLAREAAGKPSA